MSDRTSFGHKNIHRIVMLIEAMVLLAVLPGMPKQPNSKLGNNIICPTKLYTEACDSLPLDSIDVERSDLIGYISDNYTRFSIYFDSSITPFENAGAIYGKTKKRNDICSFKATIKLQDRRVEPYTFGKTSGDNIELIYTLSGVESQCKTPGKIEGTLSLFVFRFKNGKTVYSSNSGLGLCDDGIANLQFLGNWSPYNGKMNEKLRWGDGRIPDSKELDCGAGEFGPCSSFNDKGWSQYRKEYDCKAEMRRHSAACESVLKQIRWWKQK